MISIKELKNNSTFILTIAVFGIYVMLMVINPIHQGSGQKEIKEGFSDSLNFYLFYTESCPHSIKFLNEQWLTLSRKYKGKILFNKFDCGQANNKEICKRFNISSVPALFLIEGDTHLRFRGERSLDRIDSFLNKNLKEHFESQPTSEPEPTPEIIISDTLPSEEPELIKTFEKRDLILPWDAELTKTEDFDDEIYEYCVKYPLKYKKHNLCLSVNLKKEKGLQPYQVAYTVLATHLRKSSQRDPEEMKKTAYKLKDTIAGWGLAQKELLQEIYNKSEDQEDKDIVKAFLYACGFE